MIYLATLCRILEEGLSSLREYRLYGSDRISLYQNIIAFLCFMLIVLKHVFMLFENLELRHPLCVCNIKVQCKEVKNTTSILSVVMLLIERNVSAYSEAIIRFNNCQLYETNIFHETELLNVEISSSMFE